MQIPVIYEIPIVASGLLIVVILLGCAELSYRVGKWQYKRGKGSAQDSRGDSILSAMIGMLALVLAFTYSYTVTRADNRKHAVISQTNALGTAFDRAGLIDEPYRTRLRQQLLDYTAALEIRAESMNTREKRAAKFEEISALEAKLWPTVEEFIAQSDSPGPLKVAVATSINDVLDSMNLRLHAGLDRLPTAILCMLLFIAAAALSVAGFSAGRANNLRRWRMTALILSIAAIMQTITDFDRPGSGFIRTNQSSFPRLEAEMRARLALPHPPQKQNARSPERSRERAVD
ncbi:hypothetical protein [Sulfuriroseicoccus oceanibius]|uniref:DUF4239 domain-containing protein n=1 Tax=Sulfuriroseicoccus oceanibius TaxID=2707525 RepID=A0A6B3L9H6_9BACT|nr:hypothetical protein [Sulfuriroseicoccus oceanibius]QQL44184.1 hypothetical protein G3M56_009785 [Sulfuriroseicoccus oceanibius]